MVGVTIVQTVVKMIILIVAACGGVMVGRKLRIRKNEKDKAA